MNNYVTTDEVLLRIKDTFDVPIDSNKGRIVDFIGTAISLIPINIAYKYDVSPLTIESYKSRELKSDVVKVLNVINNGDLIYNNKTNILSEDPIKIENLQNKLVDIIRNKRYCLKEEIVYDICGNPINDYVQDIMDLVPIREFVDSVNYNRFGSIKKQDFWWYLEGNVIKTNIERGELLVYYKSLLLSDDNKPLIYGDPEYLEYICWFVLYRLLLRGYKHPVIDLQTARNQSDYYKRLCTNNFMFDTLDKEEFSKDWNKLVNGLSI